MVFSSCFSSSSKQLKKPSFKVITFNSEQSAHSGAAVPFTVNDVWQATGNFSPSRKIGQGGFGTVYQGKLPDGTPVAVKRAKKSSFEGRPSSEFASELKTFCKVEHMNLVRLLGFLESDDERVLVMEYVPNGNLREHLDGLHGRPLQFSTRLDIIIDIAHALTYLHHYADEPIIHRDIKSTNILLTSSFRAKVTDFGFSKTGPMESDATHVSTQVKGTAGYLDPEYLYSRQLTAKSDVYSFGILILEILTARRPIELKRSGDERITIRWAWHLYERNRAIEVLDPKMDKHPDIPRVIDNLTRLAFECAAPSRRERPSMGEVAEALCKMRMDFQRSLNSSSSGTFFTSSDSIELLRVAA